MELYFISEERHYLKKLGKILNYNISTSALFVLSFFGGFMLMAGAVAAILFTFFMLFIFIKLLKENHLCRLLNINKEQQELYDGKSPLGYDAKYRSSLSPMSSKLPEVKSRRK